MPMPGVGDREGDHVLGVVERFVPYAESVGGALDRAAHRALLGELERVGEQVLEDLLEPLLVGVERLRGSSSRELDLEVEALLARRPGGTSARRSRQTASRPTSAACTSILPGLDLGQVEDVVDQREQVAARGVDRPRELDLLVVEVALLVVGEQLDRISSELSGVRSSCDMLARNSLLYFDESASCSAFSSRIARGQLDLAVLDLDVAVLAAEQRGLLLQLLVGLLQLLLLGLQQLLGGLERLGLLLELGVRALQLLLLRLELLGLGLQLRA